MCLTSTEGRGTESDGLRQFFHSSSPLGRSRRSKLRQSKAVAATALQGAAVSCREGIKLKATAPFHSGCSRRPVGPEPENQNLRRRLRVEETVVPVRRLKCRVSRLEINDIAGNPVTHVSLGAKWSTHRPAALSAAPVLDPAANRAVRRSSKFLRPGSRQPRGNGRLTRTSHAGPESCGPCYGACRSSRPARFRPAEP